MKPSKYISRIFLLGCLLFSTLAYAQDPPQYGTPFTGVPDPRDASIYQVNMRCFSATRNFQGVINRLDSIKALGINVIYLMPPHRCNYQAGEYFLSHPAGTSLYAQLSRDDPMKSGSLPSRT